MGLQEGFVSGRPQRVLLWFHIVVGVAFGFTSKSKEAENGFSGWIGPTVLALLKVVRGKGHKFVINQ